MIMNRKAKQDFKIRNKNKKIHEQFDQLFENCYIDPISGRFHCKKCDNLVHVNLAKRVVFCSVHGMLVEEEGYGLFI
jgi:hypothetical protein